ncbi:ABC transporter ATP-binding protein/permease [Corynebacterium freiburgense]|uniref:ABC transporter ATP-binding protein/permease n=1 Tax=Corynebacterium freiburgense TaxID=556548 RepID=UPI001F0A9C14|nr:ATP-binding cassette domain-containing protein [Corynebacterium freiburgense]
MKVRQTKGAGNLSQASAHDQANASKAGKKSQQLVPYRLSKQAVYTISGSVLLTWLSVLGMCLALVGAGNIIDAYPARPSFTPIFVGLVLIFIAIVARTVLVARGQILEENRIRHRILDAVFSAGPARSATTSTGSTVALATELTEKMMLMRVGFVAQVIGSFSAPFLVVGVVAVYIAPFPALVLFLMLLVVPVVVAGFRKLVSRASSGSQDARKALAAAYMDALKSLSTLQLLGAAGRVSDQLAETGERNRVAVMQLLKVNQLILLVIDAACSLALVTTAAAMALLGDYSQGQAICLIALSILLLEPMDQIGAFFYVGMSGLGAQRGIFGFLRARATKSTKPTKPGITAQPAETDVAVVVSNMHFGYDQPIFHGANLTIRRGERVAIIGPSGQGKSTLLSLLKGDLLPQSGSVSVAGESGDGLCAASASVAQTTWLFSGTIADNLRIACPEATEEQMWEALDRAHVAEEIRRFPRGLATELGEQGLGISGGQAQRISLARAIISGRRVILLDEPTSHVDLASEREILAAINALGPEYTLILVTHRTSSLQHMDRVLRVSGGEIKEES